MRTAFMCSIGVSFHGAEGMNVRMAQVQDRSLPLRRLVRIPGWMPKFAASESDVEFDLCTPCRKTEITASHLM
jgi:hypothetical protein